MDRQEVIEQIADSVVHDRDITVRADVTWYLDEEAEYDPRLAVEATYDAVWQHIVSQLHL